MRIILFSLNLICIASIFLARDAFSANFCEMNFKHSNNSYLTAFINSKLDQKYKSILLPISRKIKKPQDSFDGSIYRSYLSLENSNKHIAKISYTLKLDQMDLSFIEVNWAYRGQGLSNLLIANALKQHPHVSIVNARPAMTNLKVIVKSLREGKSIEQASMDSPLSKSMAKFGFRLKYVSFVSMITGDSSKLRADEYLSAMDDYVPYLTYERI